MRAGLELLAGAFRTSGTPSHRRPEGAEAVAGLPRRRIVVGATIVAMPSGCRERAFPQKFSRGVGHSASAAAATRPRRRAAEIANCGEAAHQHAPHEPEGAHGHHRVGKPRVEAEIGHAGNDMHMGVDEAGHEKGRRPERQVDAASRTPPGRSRGATPRR